MKKFQITRSIRESFVVDAESFEDAVEKINNGEVDESLDLGDTFEEEDVKDIGEVTHAEDTANDR